MKKTEPLSSWMAPFELFSEITLFALHRVFWREGLKKKQVLCFRGFEVQQD